MAISAKELPLGKVFTPDFRFTIPSFQRAYIWKTENILQLVSDLDDACKSPGTPYFLGSLILVREGDNRYDVIDGQQRLVSLSIIIAVLRDLERDPDLMRQLDALLVEPGDKLRGIVTEPRLTLRERDAAFFREHVQEDNLESVFDMNDDDLATAAQRNIVANIRKTYDEISNWSDAGRQQFAQYLVNEVTLVIVTTDDLDGAHRIFDVMNMRGRRGIGRGPLDHRHAAQPAPGMGAARPVRRHVADPRIAGCADCGHAQLGHVAQHLDRYPAAERDG